MSVVGKREGITRRDIIEAGKRAQIATLPKIKNTVDEVINALQKWKDFAEAAHVSETNTESIQRALDLQNSAN